MSSGALGFRPNLQAIEVMFLAWKNDPSSVDESWRIFFEGFEIGLQQSSQNRLNIETTDSIGSLAEKVIAAYRDYGHLQADLDPLGMQKVEYQVLNKSLQGLVKDNFGKRFHIPSFAPCPSGSIEDLLQTLTAIYCGGLGVEITHLHDGEARDWVLEKVEENVGKWTFASAEKKGILESLFRAEVFERFLHTKFVGQKRFSLEGADSLIPLLETLVERAPDLGCKQIVVGMAHRGRLNVLANIMGKRYSEIFAEFEENYLGTTIGGDGDVKYHLGFSSDRQNSRGKNIHLSLTPNPSHLEFVNPVVEGRVRAKQDRYQDASRRMCLPLLIHGDAAFAGQGIVPETLNLAGLEGYSTGGTIHVIINNQVGFTTNPQDSRSTTYCTDVAKIILAPIFHVNGDDPEAVVGITKLALEYRQRFGKDVVIDLVCYRKHGHNEGDEPSFTQPVMYQKIRSHPSPAAIYAAKLIQDGVLTAEESAGLSQSFENLLQSNLEEMRANPVAYQRMSCFQGEWKKYTSRYSHASVPTGMGEKRFEEVSKGLLRLPDGFTPHPKVAALVRSKAQSLADKKILDWAMGELMAYGSLLCDGTKVRLSGQDSRRGTFSHRHSVIFDANNGSPYVPLNHLSPNQERFEAFDSMLSEAAVLGFEYGYSLDSPDSLVLWEAQFGDFSNGAQVLIDQFIAASETKWRRESGLVLLLPHGYEGQGPEHSSARLERFLQLCAENNLQICYPTSPAQFFHMLRRQIARDFRKPLVVMTPKSLLRHKSVVSQAEDFISGCFSEVLDDSSVDPGRVKRVLLCSGKVYFDLVDYRAHQEKFDTAILRLEQLSPFPEDLLKKTLDRYGKSTEFVWVQEESSNMGAWAFIEPRFRSLGYLLEYVGRDESASPAVGSKKIHEKEQNMLVEAAFGASLPYYVKAAVAIASKLKSDATVSSEEKVPAR
ncbi:MAG: 2-oxoglutarate dehydrogenase E1 component [Gemmataceae bacterium]|nr:2-oxoglutarate dehydrogenase E1 component [Gemmataceae bacterium]